MTQAQNARGEWVPAIPVPFYQWFRYRCVHGFAGEHECGRLFWTERGYRGHYALDHILYPPGNPDGTTSPGRRHRS